MSAPALRIAGLSHRYGARRALDGVSLNVAPGEFRVLLGPNGAGKSTLIGIVSSLVNKSAGEVSVFGIDLAAQRDAAMRQLGLVPQELNFNMFEKPLDICVNYAGFYGVPRAQALPRAEQVLREAQLWDKHDKMSRGNQASPEDVVLGEILDGLRDFTRILRVVQEQSAFAVGEIG